MDSRGAPTVVLVAAGLVAVQGLLLLLAGAVLLVDLVGATVEDTTGALALVVMALLAGVAVLAVARGLQGGHGWARSPAVLVQLLAFPVAVSLLQGGRWYVGGPLLAGALVVGVLLLAPATGRGLDQPPADPGEGAPTRRP